MGIKNYFALTSRERNGLFVVCMLIALISLGDYLFRYYYKSPSIGLEALQDSLNLYLSNDLELDSINIEQQQTNEDCRTKHTAQGYTREKEQLHIEVNTATKDDLVKVSGIGDYYASQIIQLREKYGGFSNFNQFNELYGMDDERLALWQKALYIDPSFKYPDVFLNSADSIQLCQIPCIKCWDARRIVQYRERLGGFYSSKQLLEVYGIEQEQYEEIMLRAVLDTIELQRIDINNITFKELMKHPYINGYENTKAIFRYLKLCPIESWSDFCQIPHLKIEHPESLKHYLCFNPSKKE